MDVLQKADDIALRFDVRRAHENTTRICQAARWMDTPAVYRAAEIAVEILAEAGIDDVRIDDVPADGRTDAAGWVMPVAWKIDHASLSFADESADGPKPLASYEEDPQSIAPWSPSTPNNAPCLGPVRTIETATETLPDQLAGSFLYLREGRPDEDLNEAAATAGALGIIATRTGAYPNASRFDNAAVPKHAERSCVASFSLSPAAAQRLEGRIAKNPNLRLAAWVRADRFEGTVPVVTGTVGSGGPEIYLCAHIDEIGALDNASGCGVAIEALRILNEVAGEEASSSSGRLIRFFFSTEVRGWQMWLNRCEPRYRHYLAGINLDMNGADPQGEPGRLQVLTGFVHRPHFAGWIIRDAAEAASRLTVDMPTVVARNFVSDAIPGISYPGGHVSLEQEPGESYHTSADTTDRLYDPTLRWSGTACVHFLYRMSHLDARDITALSRRIYYELSKDSAGDGTTLVSRPNASVGESEKKTIQRHRRGRLVLESLCRALPDPPFPLGIAEPEELYTAGDVRRSDGLSPEAVAGQEQRQLMSEWDSLFVSRPDRISKTADSPASRAHKLVPMAQFTGFLGFDNQYRREARDTLFRRTGLSPSWGTEPWAWMLLTECRGKRRLSDIVGDFAALGIDIDLERAADLIEYLAEIGKVTLRPILAKEDLVAAFVNADISKGGIYAVHASLSRFGLIDGGAATLVAAFREAAGPDATIAMPTHTLSFLGRPAYERDRTPGHTGAVPECFRNLPGVKRSMHATHSVAVLGPRTDELLSGVHPAQRPMDRQGFWGRLYELEGRVVLLCPIRSATIFHVGEAWTDLPQPSAPVHWMEASGKRRIALTHGLPWHVDHFEKQLARPLIDQGVMKTYALGDAEFFVAPSTAMADISCKVNGSDRGATLGSEGACSCAYCRELKAALGE